MARRPRRRAAVAVVVLGTLVVVGIGIFAVTKSGDSDPSPRTTPARPARPTHLVPEGIVDDCSKPVDGELNAWLASVPDGATIRFRSGACYAQEQRLVLKNRTDLVVDGGGATFKSSAPNDNSKLVPNWFLLRSDRITIRNMTIVGNFDDPGPPTPNRGSVTSNAGVGIYGGTDLEVSDVTIRRVFGDGVTVANAYYHDPEDPTHEFPRNVRLWRLDVQKAARHCVSPSQVTGFWLEDSKLDDCYLDGVDAEKDLPTDPLSDLHFLRNAVSNYFGVGIVIPIGGVAGAAPVDGIEIRGNRFTTLPTASVCNQAIALGSYENQTFSNVVIEDNQILSWKVAIAVRGVTSGRIHDNDVTHPTRGPGGDPPRVGDCGPEHEANVITRDSPGVSVEGNG